MAESREVSDLYESFCIAHIPVRASFALHANSNSRESSRDCGSCRGNPQARVTAGLLEMKVMKGRRFTAWIVMKAEAQAATTHETK